MTSEERNFLRDFFRNLMEEPLDPSDPRYVPLYQDSRLVESDPVQLMFRSISWTVGESVQLFSGFRGSGKSTELRRLRERLRKEGYLVVLCDAEDYLNMSTPVDISDFLIAVAGAFGESLMEQKLLDGDPNAEGYWERFANFLKTRVNVEQVSGRLGFGGSAVEVKANLKSDPSFKQQLQEWMSGHLGALVADVREFVQDCVKRLKKKHGDHVETVLIVDSVEHIRGTSVNAEEVQRAVETLFATHADKLRLPYLHVVYTVPPYLKVRYPSLGALYEPGGLKVLPAVKIREEASSSPSQPGIEALENVVTQRGDWKRLFGNDRFLLDKLIATSGGHLRDLVRLLREVVVRTESLPATDDVVAAAINQIRNESLPVADDDALWLERIARTHSAALASSDALPNFARFLDTHLVLCYWNGHEWYDVHPLIKSEVLAQAERLNAESATHGNNGS